MSEVVEADFPRGGVSRSKPQKQKKKDDLFKITKDEPGPEKKRRKKVKKTNAIELEEESVTVIEMLTSKTISPGMVLLGCIVEVNDYNLKITLPGGLIGHVPITSVSTPYTALLKAFAEDPNAVEETVATLQAMFSVGQTFPCKVVTVNFVKPFKTKITLSLNPSDVYEELQPSLLFHGMMLHAAVLSIEDHGYVMDIGLKGVKAFLKDSASTACVKNNNSGRTLTIGQLLPTAINMPLPNLEPLTGKVIELTAKPSFIANSLVAESEKVNLHSLLPGMIVEATIQKVQSHGLVVNCVGYPGCVYKHHLKDTWDLPSKYSVAEKVNGTVLYIHPLTRHVYLTLHPKPTPKNFKKIFEGLEKWDIVDEVNVTSVEKNCAYFKLKENVKGFAMKSDLSGEYIENAKSQFSVEKTYRCRILSLDYWDNLARVTLKESILQKKFIRKDELQVGAVFEGSVIKIVLHGMVVRLAPGVKGFVRDIHMADIPLKQPHLMFQPGTKVKCRILEVDNSSSQPSITLTCKKSLVNTKMPILTSYEDASPGLVTKGIIVLINNNGLLVSFFNSVQGWVPHTQLGAYKILHPEKVFFKGQIVDCCVMQCSPQEKILKLSLKIEGRKLFGDKDMSTNDFEIGKIIYVKVKAKTEKGLDVKLQTSGFSAFLPVMHLSDHPENCEALLKTIKVKDVLKVLCFISRGAAIVTKKASLMQAAKNEQLKQNLSDFNEGMIVPAVVKTFAFYGMFLDLGYNLTGLVPKKFIVDGKLSHPTKSGYICEQSLMAKVLKVELDRQRIEFSTRMSDVYHRESEYSLELLQSYLDDRRNILQFYSVHKGIKGELSKLVTGSLVTTVITSVTEIGVLSELTCGIKGFATKQLCGGKILECGIEYQAVVLFVDLGDECVELSYCPHLVKNVKKKRDSESCQAKVDQIIKCEALIVKKQFVLVSLGGHAVGSLAYLPTRRLLNDIAGRNKLYSVGEHYHLVVKRIYHGCILGVLKQHNREVSKPVKQDVSDSGKRKLDESNAISKRMKLSENKQDQNNCKVVEEAKSVMDSVNQDILANCTNVLNENSSEEHISSETVATEHELFLSQECKNEKSPEIMEKVDKRQKKNKIKKKIHPDVDLVSNGKTGINTKLKVKKLESEVINLSDEEKETEKLKLKKLENNKYLTAECLGETENQIYSEKDHESQSDNDCVVIQNEELVVGKAYNAVIKNVKQSQINILINNRIPGRIHITEADKDISEGTNPFQRFTSGDKLTVWVIGFHQTKSHNFLALSHRRLLTFAECSFFENPPVSLKSNFTTGQEVTGFINKIGNQSLSVWLSPSVEGELDLLNLFSDPVVLRKVRKHFSPRQAIKTTVLNVSDSSVELTKLGDWKPIPGMTVVGLVQIASADRGLLLKLPHGYRGSVALTDLSDSFRTADTILLKFSRELYIKAYILEVNHEEKFCQLSTRASRLGKSKKPAKDKEIKVSDLVCGMNLPGFVSTVSNSVLTVALGRDVEGIVPISQLPVEEKENFKNKYLIGNVINVKVEIMENDKIVLSVEDNSKYMKDEEMKASSLKMKSFDASANDSEISFDYSVSKKRTATKLESSQSSFCSNSKKDIKNNALEVAKDLRTINTVVESSLPRLQVSEDFKWDAEMTPDLSSLTQHNTTADITSSDSENEAESENTADKKKNKKLKLEKKRLDEEHLFEKEHLLMDTNREPQTVDDFDRLVVSSPNSSIVWLRYMAFHLEQAEIDRARGVAERALKTISFREEQEKLNVWVAFLNLENLYGTQESLMEVFQRAVEHNEPLKVYNHMTDIYINSEKLEEAEQLFQTMVKKFRQNKDVWIKFGLFYMKSGKPDLAHKLMDRSLKCLPEKIHVDIIGKFAQLEFKHGDSERGKTMFESILANYPKRTDLWSVYIDLMLKQDNRNMIRHIFERVITLNLSARKMKFFFKRYLDFEMKYGTEENVNEVRKKALKYVEADISLET